MSKNPVIPRTIILSLVLYGCESWSLTLKEEYKLKMFVNKVVRRICEPSMGRTYIRLKGGV
jgi:hypothetical protein